MISMCMKEVMITLQVTLMCLIHVLDQNMNSHNHTATASDHDCFFDAAY